MTQIQSNQVYEGMTKAFNEAYIRHKQKCRLIHRLIKNKANALNANNDILVSSMWEDFYALGSFKPDYNESYNRLGVKDMSMNLTSIIKPSRYKAIFGEVNKEK